MAVYALVFYCMERFICRSLYLDKNQARMYAKVRLLLAYFYADNIFNGNYKKEKLISSFSSRLTKDNYLTEWDNFEIHDKFNIKKTVSDGLNLVEYIYNKSKI